MYSFLFYHTLKQAGQVVYVSWPTPVIALYIIIIKLWQGETEDERNERWKYKTTPGARHRFSSTGIPNITPEI